MSQNPIGRVGAFRARMAGALARRDGQPVTANPYSTNGDFNERVKARYWIRGWNRADTVLREPQRATQAD
jgi:hypothetical protein